jgi:hypothetical protein
MTTIQKPTVGSTIKVKMRYSQGPLMIPPRPNFVMFEGTVLPSQKWMNPNQFCLSGDSAWPVRVLNFALIDEIELIKGELIETDAGTKTWTVPGSKGNEYIVTRHMNKFTCTCPAFGFKKTCKHITGVK